MVLVPLLQGVLIFLCGLLTGAYVVISWLECCCAVAKVFLRCFYRLPKVLCCEKLVRCAYIAKVLRVFMQLLRCFECFYAVAKVF